MQQTTETAAMKRPKEQRQGQGQAATGLVGDAGCGGGIVVWVVCRFDVYGMVHCGGTIPPPSSSSSSSSYYCKIVR